MKRSDITIEEQRGGHRDQHSHDRHPEQRQEDLGDGSLVTGSEGEGG